jgi:hypothetical protein
MIGSRPVFLEVLSIGVIEPEGKQQMARFGTTRENLEECRRMTANNQDIDTEGVLE